ESDNSKNDNHQILTEENLAENPSNNENELLTKKDEEYWNSIITE
ncbi:5594_t:CDS:1, partial [Funneliformis geosporum]